MTTYTTTQALKTNQNVKAIYALVEGRQVKILDLRYVYDTDADKRYLIADVLYNGASLPVSVLTSRLSNLYAMVAQVIQ